MGQNFRTWAFFISIHEKISLDYEAWDIYFKKNVLSSNVLFLRVFVLLKYVKNFQSYIENKICEI